MHLTIMNRIWL